MTIPKEFIGAVIGPGGRRKESGEEIPGIYILFILFVIGWTMLWKTEGIDVIL